MKLTRVRNLFFWVLALAVLAGGAYYIYQHRPAGLPAGFAFGNGRLEATEVDVATKIAGRLAELGPREGDWVEAGAVVGRIGDASQQLSRHTAELAGQLDTSQYNNQQHQHLVIQVVVCQYLKY